MSFSQQSAAPSLQDPASGRVNRWRQAEPLPWANGPFRLAPHWVSDRFNDAWTNGKQTGQAYCSVVGNICHGPIDRALYIYKDGEQVYQINVTRPNDPEDPHYWYVDFEFGGTSDGLPNYSGRLYWGREDQPADDWLIATSGQDHPPRRGVCYVIWKRLHCGQVQANSKARPALPNIEIVGVRLCSPTVPSALRLPAAYGNPALAGVNLVGGLFDLLTHPRAGIDCAALLDTATWTAAAAAVDTGAKKIAKRWGEEVHIAPVHAGQEDAEKLVDDYLSYCDGWLPIRDGKIGIDWYPNDGTVPASLPEISDHDLVLGEDETAEFGDYQDLPTLIVCNGLDFQTQLGEAVVTAPVPLVRSITGRNNPEKIDRPWIVNADYLQDYANSLATLAVTLPAKGEISVRRDRAVRLDGTPLLPGDLFKLTLMRHSFSSVCRVLERMEDDRGADVTIKWCRERGTNGLVYAPPTDPRDRYALPEPETPGANDWTVVETPPDIGSGSAVVLSRKTQPTLSGITVAIDDDDSWGAGGATLGEQGFATRIIVGSSPGPSATAATIDVVIEGDGAAALLGSGATQSEQIDNTWLLVLGSEWLSVGAVTSLMGYTYRFAVLRGRLGSTAAPHDTASYGWVIRRDLLQIWAHALFTAEATRYFKVRTYHTLAESDYSASKPVTFRIPPRRRISFYTFTRAPIGGVAKNPQEIFDALIGPFPLGTDHSSLTAIETIASWTRDIPQPTVGLSGTLAGNIPTPGDIIAPPSPELGPLTLYYCSGEFDEADNYVRDTWSDVAPIAGHMATPTALLNNAGTFLESIKSTDLASAWSSKIVAGGISIQIRKNPSTNTLEWTPDGGTTVHAMGGGGASFPAGAVDGQMIVADSTAEGGMRWTGVSVLPAPSTGVGAVLVSNGAAWYALGTPSPGKALTTDQAGIPVWANVAGITYDPNSGQPQITGTTLQCTWESGLDGNGIFYALGSNLRRQAWANPVTAWPKLRAMDSGTLSLTTTTNTAATVARSGTGSNISATTLDPNPWIVLDLGQRRQMAVPDYVRMSGGTRAPRTWRLQGSNNVAEMTPADIRAATWVDIDVRTADTTMGTTSGVAYHFVCNGDATTRFRFIRLIHTGVNSYGDMTLTSAPLELYGACTLFQFNVPAGTYTREWVSNGDGNGIIYYLGSIGLTKPFENPVWAGDIAWLAKLGAASNWTVPELTDRLHPTGVQARFSSTTTGWIVWDFGANRRLSVGAYTISVRYSGTTYLPRNWTLQGIVSLPGLTETDVEAAVWVDIDTHVADAAVNSTGFFKFTPNGDSATRFRYLRWKNTGADSSGDCVINFVDIEFYGVLEVE